MNPYLQSLEKIEFVVTYACTGRCKHCSEGDHTACGEAIDAAVAAAAVTALAAHYPLKTVMTFGGEPLLYPDRVFAIMAAATAAGVIHRQVITNGYFTADPDRRRAVAEGLAAAGVNDLLLSVDAFHQETIPLSAVCAFARDALACGIPIRLAPAWLVSRDADNPYNQKTRAILAELAGLGIPEGSGNVVFPEGNACRYLAEYFVDAHPQNPYVEDEYNVRTLSVEPNGNLLGGNLYRQSITDLIAQYAPKGDAL